MNSLELQLQQLAKRLMQLRVPLFLLFVVLVYGFIVWRINTLSNAQPSQVTSQLKSSSPRIDQATVDKIKQLRDNNVTVRALFNQARKNPFQE